MTEVTLGYKYDEDKTLKELKDYIDSTYTQHYAGNQGVQTFDLLYSSGLAEAACLANLIKYASRFGKKNGKNRKDIMKILHYAILLMWVINKEEEKKKEDVKFTEWCEMAAESTEKKEPTMEDVLAGIRKILSEKK